MLLAHLCIGDATGYFAKPPSNGQLLSTYASVGV